MIAVWVALSAVAMGLAAVGTQRVTSAAGFDATGIALLVTAVASMISAVAGIMNGRHLKTVHEEVKTGNALKIGRVIDANEQRRADGIPKSERTTAEQHASDRLHGQGPEQ